MIYISEICKNINAFVDKYVTDDDIFAIVEISVALRGIYIGGQ